MKLKPRSTPEVDGGISNANLKVSYCLENYGKILVFSDFLREVRELQMLKSGRARFLWKIHFCPNLGKNDPKIGYFAFL